MLFALALSIVVAKPKLLVHVMPWFSAPPKSGTWGWHWTMGKVDPAQGELASHYHPMIGAYDSSDPDVVEYQTLLMKVAGFDGMLVDWYGDRDRYDYLANHRVTNQLFDSAKRTSLSFAIVYEDQTLPHLIDGKVFAKDRAVSETRDLFNRAQSAWFRSSTYEKLDGKPLILVFGPQYFKDPDWHEIFRDLRPAPTFFTLHHRRGEALGAYDWPLPQEGDAASQIRREEFRDRSKAWTVAIPCAYPRFRDYYKAAGMSDGYGVIEDREGKTYESTLRDAIDRKSPYVQVATWNDWGEGTQIEPSKEFGYRDLETTQRLRRESIDPSFPYSSPDLRLPMQIYVARKRGGNKKQIDQAVQSLRSGKGHTAKAILDRLSPS